ncbi:hypothetical protein SNOUR_11270 [Streptomyces noursei ATCC 11455]|nr:hypothetical protein SNOUR_11270 [Streptomyces noursei ATCC 11455]
MTLAHRRDPIVRDAPDAAPETQRLSFDGEDY